MTIKLHRYSCWSQVAALAGWVESSPMPRICSKVCPLVSFKYGKSEDLCLLDLPERY